MRNKFYWFGENEKKAARQTERPTNSEWGMREKERENRKMENKISSTMTRSHHRLTLPPFLLTPIPTNGIVFFLNPNDNNNYKSSTNTIHFHYYCHPNSWHHHVCPFFLKEFGEENTILCGFSRDWGNIGYLNLSWFFGEDFFSWL